jgi:hypothetical protein
MGSSPIHSQIPVYQSPQSIPWPPQSGRDCAAVPRTPGMGRYASVEQRMADVFNLRNAAEFVGINRKKRIPLFSELVDTIPESVGRRKRLIEKVA